MVLLEAKQKNHEKVLKCYETTCIML